MIPLHDFIQSIDAEHVPAIEVGKKKGLIDPNRKTEEFFDDFEKAHARIIEAEQRVEYRKSWQRFVKFNLNHKKPFLLNSKFFEVISERPYFPPREEDPEEVG